MAEKPETRVRADSAVAVLPRPVPERRITLAKLLPSGRSVLIAVTVSMLGAGMYFLARESSLFALRTIEVEGAPPAVATRVRAALERFEGSSLVTLDGAAVRRRLAELPVVASARYDRDFPHSLRVYVRAERPVAVVRRGPESWLLSARGRVMAQLERRARSDLPRIWVARPVSVSLGATLGGDPAQAVEVAVPLAGTPLRRRVASIRADTDELTLVLRSGLELRLGDDSNLALKLAIGRRIAGILGPARGYVDLAVPGRPVSNVEP